MVSEEIFTLIGHRTCLMHTLMAKLEKVPKIILDKLVLGEEKL